MPAEVLEAPKTAAPPAAAPTPSPAPSPSPGAGVPPPAAPANAPAAGGDDNPYGEVDAAFTKAGIAEAPKAADKPPKADKAPGVPKELRAELDRVKGELKAKSESYASLEAKIADYERRGKDTSVLSEQLETERKEKEELRAELRRAKKEVDPEFVKKYEAPFNRLADRARSVVEQIQVEDTEAGTVKAATWADFTKVYGLNEFIATKEAKRLFGEDGAGIAMGYYRQLHELEDSKRTALEEVKAKWKEEETAEESKRIQTQQQINEAWTKANADLQEKVEDYHDSPEDKELADARQKALTIFDSQPKTLKDRIIKDAHNRQRVAAFPVLKMKIDRANKEIAELKAELDGIKEKPPGKTTRPGGTAGTAPEESYEEYIRKSVTA